MKVGIVTDTNSGMTQEEGKKYGIHILPMPFMIDGEIYHEGVNLSHEEFYRMQEEGADITTSQPSPEEVLGLWKELLETYDQLVHNPMSSSLSSSCQTAMMLAQEYEDRVFVVDNQRISITQRQSALDGKMMADRGMDGASIKKVLEDTRLDASIYVTVDTLKYLKKGGRITPAAAALGTLLRLKPVLTVQGGKLDAFAKARTMKQAKSIMITAIQNDLEQRFGDKGCKKCWLQIAHTSSPEIVSEWQKELGEAFPGTEIYTAPLSLSIACHIGPGALAVAITKKIEDVRD